MHDDLSHAQWRKSSCSGNTGNCVEVAITDSVVGIRDSKNPDGPKLTVSPDAWRTFIDGVQQGEFGLD
jgi:hypothetical protein